MHTVRTRFIAALLGIIVFVVPPVQAAPLPQGASSALINRVDTTAFPTIRVYVSVSDGTGGRPSGLTAADFSLQEDGAPTPELALAEEQVGVQLALLVDASGNTRQLPGRTGELLITEIKEAISGLALTDAYIDRKTRKDWVTILTPKDKKVVETLVPWTTDYNLVYNNVYQYRVPEAVEDTPLFKMLFEALRGMGPTNAAVPMGLQRSIIVFSDGIDIVSDLELQDAANRALALGVPLHTVHVGTKGNVKNMSRLAELTNGTFTEYGAAAPGVQSLDALFKKVTSQRTQMVLTYQSHIKESGIHAVAVTYKPGPTSAGVSATTSFPIVVKPPAVTITAPTANTAYNRVALAWDTPLTAVEPRGDSIQIKWSFPDGYQRNVVAAEYEVDGVAFKVDQAPFERFAWDFAALDAGPHSIRARVRDEQGLWGESEAVQVQINVTRPPTPTPTPLPTPGTVEVKEIVRTEVRTVLGPVSYLALGLAGLALLGVLYIIIFRREVVREATTAVKRGVSIVTEPFLHKASARPQTKALAVLRVVSGGDPNRKPVPLFREETKVGRDAALADVIFEDRRVSRLHCRIRQDQPGQFTVLDEGSTSGTYVNDELVPMNGRWLDHGDQVDVGPIRLRFELVGGSPLSPIGAQTESMQEPTAPTEPMELRSDRRGGTPDIESDVHSASKGQLPSDDSVRDEDATTPLMPDSRGRWEQQVNNRPQSRNQPDASESDDKTRPLNDMQTH